MQEFQLLDYDRKLKNIYAKAKDNLSSANLTLISKYDAEMATLGLKKSTRAKQLSILVDITIRIGKNWYDIVKDDIDKLIRSVMDEFGDNLGGESETTRDYKKSLKLFFRWFKLGSRDYKEVGDPSELKSIRLKQVREKIVREQLLTEEDHAKLLKACAGNARDQAFLDTHYEAGTRPGEILTLKIKHVKFDDKGAVIHVDGKTSPRPIRLVTSVPNLAKWLNIHPFKDDPEYPLWILFDEDNYGNQMTYSAAVAMLQRRIRKAKIKKKINLKLFRHSAATRLSKYLPESTMRLRHGWTRNSTMPARYVHLNSSDVDDAILKNADLRKCNLLDSTLCGSNLVRADFGRIFPLQQIKIYSKSENISFEVGADLEGANFSGANLNNANLKHASIMGAKFDGAILIGTILDDINLDDATRDI